MYTIMSLKVQGKAYVISKDIELKKLQGGGIMLSFYVSAWDYSRKLQDGTYENQYSSHKLVIYGALAERVFKNGIKKSDTVFITGDARVNRWTPQGSDKLVYENYILVESLEVNHYVPKEEQQQAQTGLAADHFYDDNFYGNSIPNPTDGNGYQGLGEDIPMG